MIVWFGVLFSRQWFRYYIAFNSLSVMRCWLLVDRTLRSIRSWLIFLIKSFGWWIFVFIANTAVSCEYLLLDWNVTILRLVFPNSVGRLCSFLLLYSFAEFLLQIWFDQNLTFIIDYILWMSKILYMSNWFFLFLLKLKWFFASWW